MKMSKLKLFEVEEHLNRLFSSKGVPFIGWIRGKQPPGEFDDPSDYTGVLFKEFKNRPLPFPHNECKDVADLMRMREQKKGGFILMPMLPIHFDNLDKIVNGTYDEMDELEAMERIRKEQEQ